jgi:hypothetical protein
MSTYILGLPPAEVLRLLRAETEEALGAPELNTSTNRDYLIEEEFNSNAYGIRDGEKFDLVFFCKLKQFRAIATRYDKTARNFFSPRSTSRSPLRSAIGRASLISGG